MNGVEVYRFAVVAAAGFCIALNLFVGFQWTRAWFRMRGGGWNTG